jgi:hypothetical protein
MLRRAPRRALRVLQSRERKDGWRGLRRGLTGSRHEDASIGDGGNGVSRSGHGGAVIGPRHADGLTRYSPNYVERLSEKGVLGSDSLL